MAVDYMSDAGKRSSGDKKNSISKRAWEKGRGRLPAETTWFHRSEKKKIIVQTKASRNRLENCPRMREGVFCRAPQRNKQGLLGWENTRKKTSSKSGLIQSPKVVSGRSREVSPNLKISRTEVPRQQRSP